MLIRKQKDAMVLVATHFSYSSQVNLHCFSLANFMIPYLCTHLMTMGYLMFLGERNHFFIALIEMMLKGCMLVFH